MIFCFAFNIAGRLAPEKHFAKAAAGQAGVPVKDLVTWK